MNNKRNSMVFYRSFYEAIKELPEVNQLEIYNAIFCMSFDFTEPNLTGISKTVWTLIKPQIEANIAKYLNGILPKTNQNSSIKKANNKQTKSKPEGNVNENENENENDNKLKLSFIEFYEMYGVKTKKQESEKIWAKMSNTEREMAMVHSSWYITDRPKEFRLYPDKYLRQKVYLDDQIQAQTQNESKALIKSRRI